MASYDFTFTEAQREKLLLRLALTGVTGGGKTWTALALATYMLGGDKRDPSMTRKIAVIDSERGSAEIYGKGKPWHFSHLKLKSFEPEAYVAAIKAAERQGFEVIIIDSLSHEWAGTGGALEQVDRGAKNGNTFVAWGSVTPRHNAVIDTIMGSSCHVIATMRAKMAHEQTIDDKGKKVVKKLGLAPVQREGIEYEFTIVADMDIENTMTVVKARMEGLLGRVIRLPGRDLADEIMAWLDDGEAAPLDHAKLAAEIIERVKGARSAGDVEESLRQTEALPEALRSRPRRACYLKMLAGEGTIEALTTVAGRVSSDEGMTDEDRVAVLAFAEKRRGAVSNERAA